jgi:small Trp-rich protein
MALLVIGLLLLVAKLAGLSPFGGWSWWVVAVPFIGAAVWWVFVDASGITARRVAAKMEARKEDRRLKAMEALGLDTSRQRRGAGAARPRPQPMPERPAQAATTAEPPATPPRRDPRL